MPRVSPILLALFTITAGCGGGSPDPGSGGPAAATDAAADSPADQSVDGDASVDSSPDASPDSADAPDTGADSPVDSAADASPDVVVEVSTDVTVDPPDETTTNLDAGSDASSDVATDVPDDALADDGSTGVATLGAACSTVGELGCAGHASQQLLICSPTGWQANGMCAANERCDTRPGATLGTCLRTLSLCAGSQPGDIVCSQLATNSRVQCGPDLVSVTLVEACVNQACTASGCIGVCKPNQQQCAGINIHDCDATGQWGAPVACDGDGGACFDVVYDAGAFVAATCRPCATGARRCDGGTPQTCDSFGFWQADAPCEFACTGAGVCTGVCSPMPGDGGLPQQQCVGDQLQLCGPGGTWQNFGAPGQYCSSDGGASDGSQDACAPSLVDAGACGNCVAQSCCSQYAACEADSNCANKMACFIACTASGTAGPTCSSTCGLATDASPVVVSLVSCAITSCPACSH